MRQVCLFFHNGSSHTTGRQGNAACGNTEQYAEDGVSGSRYTREQDIQTVN
jgi:hypothetical protein